MTKTERNVTIGIVVVTGLAIGLVVYKTKLDSGQPPTPGENEEFKRAFNQALQNSQATSQRSGEDSTNPGPQSWENVTASQLSLAYKDNELAADSRYKGTAVQLQGRVQKVERFAGDIIVYFQGRRFDRVRAYVRPSDEGLASQLHSGQTASVRCIVKGAAALGTPTLKDCTIVTQ